MACTRIVYDEDLQLVQSQKWRQERRSLFQSRWKQNIQNRYNNGLNPKLVGKMMKYMGRKITKKRD